MIRNKKIHFRELPPEIQQQIGDVSKGYLRYFTVRFPRLTTVLYSFALRYLKDEPRISSVYLQHP